MGFLSQLKLLLWKNWLLQKRKICVSIFEVLLPVSFALLIVMIRTLVEVTDEPNVTNYTADATIFNATKANFPESNMILGYAPQNTETTEVMNRTLNIFITGANVGIGSNIKNCK